MPAYAELVAATRREGEALLSAARMGLDAPVPTCGDWDVSRLVVHVGRVFHRAARLVSERRTTPPEEGFVPRPPDDVDPVDYTGDALEELVAALAGAAPDDPVWNWSGADATAHFWARRMAHESSVHRWDAQNAHGVSQPIGADLASDGISELAEVIVPRIYERGVSDGPIGTLGLAAADDGSWRFGLAETGLTVLGPDGPADATAHGPACDLLLVLYGRLPIGTVEVAGDAGLLDAWVRALQP
jgi:uncharacterized protein (TIGR03083 family)